MFSQKNLKKMAFVVLFVMLGALMFGCTPQETEEPAVEETAAVEEPAAEKTSITILIPDNPVAFNGINTDTGYEQALGELVMLSLAETEKWRCGLRRGNLVNDSHLEAS